MQFKHPELLYALLLLLIPIIVHLFQLRRFKEVPFTNVAFLKEVSMQTRKSSQLKKWLTLLTRLLLLGCLVFAFAQPFTSKIKSIDQERETVIYVDNSFSMQAKGPKGELLKRALQDIITSFPEDEKLTLFTNTNSYINTSIKAVKNELLQTSYSSDQLDYNASQLKASNYFSEETNSIKNFIMVSDFQQKSTPFNMLEDSTINRHLVQLKPVTNNNTLIDSLFISKINSNTIKLDVRIKNNNKSVDNLPISLYDGENLLAKTSVSMKNEATAQFDIPSNKAVEGKIVINDSQVQFDNELYFNINSPEKINVLSINEDADDYFLKRVYTADEFNYSASKLNRLNYSDLTTQNVIILNELESIPNSLITAINSFTNDGGYIVIIPSNNIILNSYNQLFTNYNLVKYNALINQEKRVTTIRYSHPLYSGVFDKKIDNFQYPKVAAYFPINANTGSVILEYEDGRSFLQKNGNAYIFSASITSKNSNFKNSPLIVPTLYNIARQSLQLPKLYFTIGKVNNFDVNTTIQQDNVLKLTKNNIQIIPQQHPFTKKTRLTTNEEPSESGIYSVMNADDEVKKVSYNYNREESVLSYFDIESTYPSHMTDSISEVIEELKSNAKVNELWKWFVIFALMFLLIEMLILKYIK